MEADAIWSDDGIVVHLPDADQPPPADLVLLEPDEIEDLVVRELGGSALFGARFRENAARSLLIPRAYPGKRTPLWQQRLKSQNLLEVAKDFPRFPVILETYRECLRDVLDLPGLEAVLRDLRSRRISLVEVETPTASPFASSLLFDYVATYMYEGDTPNAERRAAALALDRELLRELLGQEELRELIDEGALEQVEADLQRIAERTRAESVDALHDVLRRVGELTTDEAALRVAPGSPTLEWLEQLANERRAMTIRIGGERRWAATEDAGLYRDALGAVPPSGLPEVFTADVPDAMERLVRRFARTHGPFETGALRDRYGVDFSPVLKALEVSGDLVRGELRPGGTQREWCDPEVLRRLRRASLAALRKEIEPADQRALARFLPNWQGVDRHPPAGAGPDRLREALIGLQGLALPAEVWERDVLPRRVGAYSPSWMDMLCAAGELVWIGAGPLGRRSGRVALYFREDVRLLGPPPPPKEAPSGRAQDAIRERLATGACFLTDLLADIGGLTGGGASPRGGAGPSRRSRAAGRSSRRCSPHPRTRPPAAAPRPSCCSSATASSPASRCWPRASPAASRRSTTSSPRWRPSASRGAAISSRASAGRSSRCRERSSACARSATTTPRPRSCSPPPTPPSRTAPCSNGRSAKAARPPGWPAPTSCWLAR